MTLRPKAAIGSGRKPWAPRTQSVAGLLLGSLLILMGVFLTLGPGLSIQSLMYLGFGGLIVALSVAHLLGFRRRPAWSGEEELTSLARPSRLAIFLLIGAVAYGTGVAFFGRTPSSGVVSLAIGSGVVIVLFLYARWRTQENLNPSTRRHN
jgi:hypothetical protein